MQQTNHGGENYSVKTGEGNTNFFGGIHHHAASQRSATGIPHNLPYGTSQFVGRDADLERLHRLVQRETMVPISAVTGMGGLGKTELALQYAYCHLEAQTYPGGICWLRAGEKQDLGTQIVLFARTGLDLLPPDDLELAEKAQWCWQHWRKGDVLVIFDDVWNYDSDTKPDQKYPKVELVLPPAEPRFRVLITSRFKLLASEQRLELAVLTEAAALELLRSLVTDGRIDQQLDVAKRICEWLGYLPLGLELVGHYLAQSPDTSLAKLEQRLQARRLQAHALKDASRNLVAAFELSWETLDESGQELAALLSLFAPAEICWRLVEACLPNWDEEDLEGVRNHQLLHRHLLQWTGEGYQLHQLLREFFAAKREQMANDVAVKQTVCRVMAAEATQMPTVETQAQIEQFTPVIPHLKEVATTLCSWLTDADLIYPSTRVAQFYKGQANYESALPWYQHCLEIAESRLGKNHPDVATSLSNLAELYRLQGHYSEAEQFCLRSISIREQQLGADHLDVALSLNNLASLYLLQGRYAKAEVYYQQSLSIHEQQLGTDHLDVAISLNNLASLYQAQGRYGEVETLHQRSLSIREQQLGSNHLDVATSLNNLANLYQAQGRYTEAEPFYQRSLSIRERQLDSNHPALGSCLNNLANLYQAQGRYTEAEPLFKRLLIICEEKLGENHPNVALSLNNLAYLYSVQGRYAEAEPLHKRSLAICEEKLGENHPNAALSLNNLAYLYSVQGRYAEAEPLYLRSLSIREQQLGKDHADVAQSLNNLASLYQTQGRYAEAEPLYRRSLEIWEQQLGKDHPNVAQCFSGLAYLYYVQGRYSEAEPLYQRSLVIQEHQLDRDHPDIASNLSGLAALYQAQGRNTEAEVLYGRALSVWQRLGINHPNAAGSLHNLGELYRTQERYAEAEPFHKRSLAIWEEQLGANHLQVAIGLNALALLYYSQERYVEAEPLYIRAITILGNQLGGNHPNTQTCKQNFLTLLHQASEAGQTSQLSDHPLTQAVLRQLQIGNGNA